MYFRDLLLRMQNPINLRKQTHLLLNYAVDQEHEIIKSNLKRGFQLQDEIMNGITDTVMATFFDLYENGNEGEFIIAVGRLRCARPHLLYVDLFLTTLLGL